MTSSYDELPYADYCFERTHPERLAAIATLCGRDPPPFERSRVLELGCARGANLLPMALDLPHASFVGVDLSAAQIAEAQQRARALGLQNVSFEARSLEDLGAGDGEFDYVIAHGVYSWVPPGVRRALLRVCRERLRPKGIALVSYNALPGWNGLRTIREFLAEHAPDGPALKRVARARRALALLAETLRADASPWSLWMRDELALLAEAEDAYLFHEHLEAENDAFYLRDFSLAARDEGLAHLGDADLRVARALLSAPPESALDLAQSIDFTENRRFRSALLVRAEEGAGRADPACVARLWLATRAEPVEGADAPQRFAWEYGEVAPRDPWTRCAMQVLVSQSRRPISFAALATAVGEALGLPRPAALRQSAEHARDVIELLFDGAVTAHLGPARWASEAGLHPDPSPLARMQAERSDLVTTLRHTRVELPEDPRAVLRVLDGARDRRGILDALSWSRADATRAARCEEALDWLAENALLRA